MNSESPGIIHENEILTFIRKKKTTILRLYSVKIRIGFRHFSSEWTSEAPGDHCEIPKRGNWHVLTIKKHKSSSNLVRKGGRGGGDWI